MPSLYKMIKPHQDSLIFTFFAISMRITCFNYASAYKKSFLFRFANTLLEVEELSDVKNKANKKKNKKVEETEEIEVGIHPKIKESLTLIGNSQGEDRYVNCLYDIFENVVNKELSKI